MESPRHHRRTLGLKKRGFTLIELLVVLSIMAILTVIVIVTQGDFNKSVTLSNTAYDIALSIQSAETYGIGGRAVGTYQAGYGIDFNLGASNSSYTLFADTDPAPNPTNCHGVPVGGDTSLNAQPGDCVYSSNDTAVTTYSIGNGIKITDLCGYDGSGWKCFSSGNLSKLDIVFSRPNADPFMSKDGVYLSGANRIVQACITISSPQGATRSVEVLSSGEISTLDTCS